MYVCVYVCLWFLQDDLLEKPDPLKLELEEREKRAKEMILNAGKLIAPALDKENWTEGYDWVIDALSEDHDKVSSEVAILKATTYLKKGNFEDAISALKAFEKKDRHLKAKAATNLSFVYYLEGDIKQADEYANMAVRYHRYNAKALVNKGNCYFVQAQVCAHHMGSDRIDGPMGRWVCLWLAFGILVLALALCMACGVCMADGCSC